jgi:hypothetical protein
MELGKNFQLRIVFTAKNTESDIQTPISRHLLALYQLPDKNIVKNALHDWYRQTIKYEEWAKKYPIVITPEIYDKLNAHLHWCELSEIQATPLILINGYKLPVEYELADLKYIIP